MLLKGLELQEVGDYVNAYCLCQNRLNSLHKAQIKRPAVNFFKALSWLAPLSL